MNKILLFLCVVAGLAFSQTAYIIDNTNTVTDVYSSAAQKVYADTFGVNPDLGMRLCGAGMRYVAAVYSADLGGGTVIQVPVSWNLTTGSPYTLVYTSINAGGGCYYTPIDAFAFSQFRDFSRTPPVFVSAFPGRIHAMYSNNVDGSGASYVGIAAPNGWLRGSYSTTRSFSQATGNVTADVTSITFETDVGSISRSPADAEWGLSSTTGRSMLIALCSDDIGDTCDDAIVVNTSAQLPVQLDLGLPVNDQVVYNRFVVVDGLGDAICIGSDLSTSISANPSNIYYGATSNITITLTNNGNVDITTDFILALNMTGPGGYTNNTQWTITNNLAAGGGTTSRSIIWPAEGASGTYTFTARGDQNNQLAECNKNNNNASTNVNVNPFYTLHIMIDDNYTNIFPLWGRPYNVTMWVTDSNNNTVANPRFVITETNGLSLFSPTQVWNDSGTGRGLSSFTRAEMVGNASGYARFVLSPTCNLLYTVYASENVAPYVGNYGIIVNVFAPGALILAYNGTLTTDVPLLIEDYTCADPGWVNDHELVNKDQYVLWIYDWIYQMYAITMKLVVP
ncbi:MAG: CARDB domain-containing protein [Candidatus Micrarchaeota archaeon]